MSDFFPKIPRLDSDVFITEKIDGTNAGIRIVPEAKAENLSETPLTMAHGHAIYAMSKSRFITPEYDNFGFAYWVLKNAEDLILNLKDGVHFGEWWGKGIQRGYGLTDRRFSLFNVAKWKDQHENLHFPLAQNPAPLCCHVVPLLWHGPIRDFFYEEEGILYTLKSSGSEAAQGFPNPEGIMLFHERSNQYFKNPFDKRREAA